MRKSNQVSQNSLPMTPNGTRSGKMNNGTSTSGMAREKLRRSPSPLVHCRSMPSIKARAKAREARMAKAGVLEKEEKVAPMDTSRMDGHQTRAKAKVMRRAAKAKAITEAGATAVAKDNGLNVEHAMVVGSRATLCEIARTSQEPLR